MVFRIDLFMPPRSQYGVLNYFTEKMAEALRRQGVECSLLEAEYYNPRPFLDKLLADKPDCTLSFNGLLPDDEGRFFCDMIGIPHVACVVDTPTHFFSLAHSPNTIITNTDTNGCAFFRGLGAPYVLFMPHGVDSALAAKKTDGDRPYDLVMFTSLIDYREIRQSWREKYPAPVVSAIEEAARTVLSDNTSSCTDAFVSALNKQMQLTGGIDPAKINFIELLDDLEMYVKGKGRISLLRAIKKTPINLYGSPAKSASWNDYLGDCPNIAIHDAVPFEQVLELMKQSKIVLNNSPWMKGGGHERLFSAMACGALALTDRNPYLSGFFEDGANIAFYENGALDKIDAQIADYLSDEERCEAVAASGKLQTALHHTWDQRAISLLEQLKPMIAKIKAVASGG